jgi:hypothetical protein
MAAFAQGALVEQLSTTATSGGVLTLTAASTTLQRFTGTADHEVVLPDATTVKSGRRFRLANRSSGVITVKTNGGAILDTVPADSEKEFYLYDNSTAAGVWDVSVAPDQESPLKLSQNAPTPNAILVISSNVVVAEDGSNKSTPPVDDVINAYPKTTINFQTGALTGGVVEKAGQVQVANYDFPNTTIGDYRRIVFTYKSAQNVIDSAISAPETVQANLVNPGTLFATLDGIPVGYLDIQATAAQAFKTAGSTSDIVENRSIFRFASGAAGGAGGDTSFRLQSINNSGDATLKKGSIILDDGRELFLSSDLTFNLKTEVNTFGITDPEEDTQYYLYLDLLRLPDQTNAGNSDRKVYVPEFGETGMLTVLETSPEETRLERYLPLASLKTDSSGDYTLFDNLATRRHQQPSVAISPLVETIGPLTIGNVGDADNLAGGHVLDVDSFPLAVTTSQLSFYNLAANANDGFHTRNLTNNNTTPFTGTSTRGSANAAALLNGTDQGFSSTDAFFNPGPGVSFGFGGWFAATDWTPSGARMLASNWPGASDMGFYINLLSNGNFEVSMTNSASSPDFVMIVSNPGFVDGSWHHLFFYFDFTAQQLRFYIDGVLDSSMVATNQRSVTASLFTVGNLNNSGNFFAGRIQDVVFIKGVSLSDLDINKLASVRIDLADTSVSPEDQFWTADIRQNGFQTQVGGSWLLDKKVDKVYADFGGPSPAQVVLKKSDMGIGARTIPVRTTDRTYYSDPGTSIAHGLPAMPTDIRILHDEAGDGQYRDIAIDVGAKADSQNIYADLSTYTIDLDHPIKVVANIGMPAVGADKAEFLVKTGTYTAKPGDKIFADTSGGAFTITLPANPGFGAEVEIFDPTEDWDVNPVTVARNGQRIDGEEEDDILDVEGASVRYVFFNATQGWRTY